MTITLDTSEQAKTVDYLQFIESVKKIISYNWDSEFQHYNEDERPDHIFVHLDRAQRYLEENNLTNKGE